MLMGPSDYRLSAESSPRRGWVQLLVTSGPHEGLSFTFEDHESFLVGRSPQAHCRLPDDDPYISRYHFLIEVSPPHCRLLDLESQNGTLVNGQRVESCGLHDGDEIHTG